MYECSQLFIHYAYISYSQMHAQVCQHITKKVNYGRKCPMARSEATVSWCLIIRMTPHGYQGVPTQLATRLFFFSKVQAKIKGNIKDMHHWSFMRGIHRWLVDSHHKGPPVSYIFLIRNLSLYEESCYFSSTNSLETTYSSPMRSRHLSWV